MAITDFGPLWIPTIPAPFAGSAPGFSTHITIDQALEGWAAVIKVPRTGTLDKFEFRLGLVTNVPDNGIKVSFQDLVSSLPDGVVDQFRNITSGLTASTWQAPGLMTSDGTDTGVKRSVTVGDPLACVIEFVSFVASDSFGIQVIDTPTSGPAQLHSKQMYPAIRSSAGTWAAGPSAGLPVIALKYDDGTYEYIASMFYPILNLNTVNFNNASTPDERGLLFQVPTPLRLAKLWMRAIIGAAADIVLYDPTGSVLFTETLDTTSGGDLGGYHIPLPPTELTEVGSDYRIVLKPTSGSNVTLFEYDVSTNAHLRAIEGGTGWIHTQRTDAGAWTNTNTKRPWMSLAFNGIEVSAGGGAQHAFAF